MECADQTRQILIAGDGQSGGSCLTGIRNKALQADPLHGMRSLVRLHIGHWCLHFDDHSDQLAATMDSAIGSYAVTRPQSSEGR